MIETAAASGGANMATDNYSNMPKAPFAVNPLDPSLQLYAFL